MCRLILEDFRWQVRHQQDIGFDTERFCDFIKPVDSDAVFLALESADVSSIDHRGIGECFLRQASGGA